MCLKKTKIHKEKDEKCKKWKSKIFQCKKLNEKFTDVCRGYYKEKQE